MIYKLSGAASIQSDAVQSPVGAQCLYPVSRLSTLTRPRSAEFLPSDREANLETVSFASNMLVRSALWICVTQGMSTCGATRADVQWPGLRFLAPGYLDCCWVEATVGKHPQIPFISLVKEDSSLTGRDIGLVSPNERGHIPSTLDVPTLAAFPELIHITA